jgi:hypothetical protein
MARPGKDGYIYDDVLEWAVDALHLGSFCLRVLVLSIERGDAKLPIDPIAWENTMTAMEWMLMQRLNGNIQSKPIVPEDLERLRRVHALGSEAMSGGERAPELVPLADQALTSVSMSGWRRNYPGYPVCYPLPEGYGDPEEGTSSSP